jgi:RHS repeat-associated protein
MNPAKNDAINRPTTLNGSLSGQVTNYVTASRYWAAAKYWTIYGNSVWNIWGGYNARLQPTAVWQNINNAPTTGLRMEMPNWVDGNGHNNGTLQGTTILAGGPDSLVNLPQYRQTFGYDSLNRLTSASESSASGSWSQTYQYDAWGNMWMPTNSLGAPAIGPGAPTANVYSASGPGKNRNVNSTYDAAGNLTLFGSMNVSYDAENRQTAAGATNYFYDGAGQRVKKVAASGTTVYVYDAFGQLAAEYASGPATGSPCGSTCYLSYDLLGSVRMVTDGQHNVIARHDYAPFGQEIPAGVGGRTNFWAASDSVNQKFTGYERDGETALDFAQARYMSAGLGRFMSADPVNAGADFTNPQSWNGYAYVLGNPLGNVDPSGMDDVGTTIPISTLDQCALSPSICLQQNYALYSQFVNAEMSTPSAITSLDPFRLLYNDVKISLETGRIYNLDTTGFFNSAMLLAALPPNALQAKPGTQTASKIGSCLVKGAVVGGAGTLAVGGLAVGAVTLGAPVAVVTGVLGIAGAAGGGYTLYDSVRQAANGNWTAVAYNIGTIGGSAMAGGASAGWVRTGITGETSGWNLGKDWQQGYKPNYPGGSLGKWLGTGPNPGSAAGSTAAIGAGISKVLQFFSSGC